MSICRAFQTSDLGLASALSCLGHVIAELDRTDPRRVIFRFVNEGAIEKAVREYWDGTLRLPPALLFTHQKLLKRRIYDEPQ